MKLVQRTLLLSVSLLALSITPVLAATLPNPIGISNPQVIVGNLIRAILGITGSLALLVFIYGGFSWVTSAGSADKIQKGKDMMFWAAVGLAVIFFSYALVLFVISAVAGQGGTGGAPNGVGTQGAPNTTGTQGAP